MSLLSPESITAGEAVILKAIHPDRSNKAELQQKVLRPTHDSQALAMFYMNHQLCSSLLQISCSASLVLCKLFLFILFFLNQSRHVCNYIPWDIRLHGCRHTQVYVQLFHHMSEGSLCLRGYLSENLRQNNIVHPSEKEEKTLRSRSEGAQKLGPSREIANLKIPAAALGYPC